jgi:hypothetical protein
MTSPTPPGWHPDPSESPAESAVTPAVPVVPAYGHPNVTPQWQPVAASGGGFRHANRLALSTFGVVVVYLVLATATKIVFFGILPLGLSIRSARAKEPLAPFAVGAAVLSMVVAAALIF